ncbi:MAG: uncharacterized membrane protein YhaH (DUF805 family) [Kiritimatiellia bacterium]|jgi:uncharacterized membrane protein YhaH (DUF805 family)
MSTTSPFSPPNSDRYSTYDDVEFVLEPSVVDVLTSFKGRITRGQYWLKGVLPIIGIAFAAGIVSAIAGEIAEGLGGLVMLAAYVPLIWFWLATRVKRWHDRGKSGWMVLIAFIPLVGPLWTFIEVGCMPGTPGRNQFGPDPRGGSW